MNVSPYCKTPKSGKNYIQSVHPKMSVNTKNTTDGSEALGAKEIHGTINGFSLELIEQRIRAHLEPLIAQFSKLTQLLNQLIKDNSAMTTPTAGPRTHRFEAGTSFKREARTSRAQPVTIIADTSILISCQGSSCPKNHSPALF